MFLLSKILSKFTTYAPLILFPESLAMAWLQQHYFSVLSEDF